MKGTLLFLLIIASFVLNAQNSQKFLIRAGKLFDSETGQFKTDMAILVNENKIEAVKSGKEVTTEEQKNYTQIDLSLHTVLPGLIDCHTHLLFKEVLHPGNSLAGLDMNKSVTMEGDAYRAIYGAARAKAYLEAGITGVQDLGNSGTFADMALHRSINEGIMPGPRMRCSGPGLASEGGQIPGLIYKHRAIVNDEYRIIKGTDDAIQAVRENITQGATVIKIFSDNVPNKTMLSAEEIQAIVKEAHRYNVRVTAHAVSNQSVHNAVLNGVDAIEHGYSIDDTTLTLMAKKGVFLVPTDGDSVTILQYAKLQYPDDPMMVNNIMGYRKNIAERLQRAMKKGVLIAAGSDDYIDFKLPFAEPSKRTLIGYIESGVSIPKVLQFATINASKQCNWGNVLGILKKGYFADIIAVDNNLDQNINAILNVHFVMKDGKVYLDKEHRKPQNKQQPTAVYLIEKMINPTKNSCLSGLDILLKAEY